MTIEILKRNLCNLMKTWKKKEALALQEGLWTLQEPERINKHHEFFLKKFDRSFGTRAKVAVYGTVAKTLAIWRIQTLVAKQKLKRQDIRQIFHPPFERP